MREKELYAFWKKYIDRPIYRVVSGFHFDDIIKKGIDPSRDPYEIIKPKLIQFFKMIIDLEENRGHIMHFRFGSKDSVGSFWAKVSIADLEKSVVDFTPKESDLEYYMNLKGGALSRNVERFTKRIIEDKPSLIEKEWALVNELNRWAKEMIIENKIIIVKGSAKFFENAMFQLTGLSKTKVRKKFIEKYATSPFGSFEHFLEFVKKNDLRKYTYRLRNNKYYLRVRDRIPASEIKVMR